MEFWKMHGLGNDYIYMDCFREQPADPSSLSIMLSDRHCSVGGDGIILLLPSSCADLRMRIFNADGSEARMCGNGIRCLGKMAYETGICHRKEMTVETASGVRRLFLHTEDGVVDTVRVDMGAPELRPGRIPVLVSGDAATDVPLTACGRELRACCVSMGNPHAVIFTNEPVDKLPVEQYGSAIEHDPLFPDRVNAEFVNAISEDRLSMRVWERGSGETMACGTGACAVAAAAILRGFCRRDSDITVSLPGGELTIRWDEETLWMTGPAVLSFKGSVTV